MSENHWQIAWFTGWVSLLSTLLILPFGVGLAWLLARKNWFGKSIVETVVALPLVIPPVATGFILLRLFGRKGIPGSFLEEKLGLEIVFTWRAVLLALAVMSFPLLVRTVRVAFESVNPRYEQVARTLGASPLKVFFTITLPLAFNGIIAGMALAFARALGEFGATVIVAGAIPDRTATLSVSIFSHIQLGQDAEAMQLLLISLLLSFAAVWVGEMFVRKSKEVH